MRCSRSSAVLPAYTTVDAHCCVRSAEVGPFVCAVRSVDRTNRYSISDEVADSMWRAMPEFCFACGPLFPLPPLPPGSQGTDAGGAPWPARGSCDGWQPHLHLPSEACKTVRLLLQGRVKTSSCGCDRAGPEGTVPRGTRDIISVRERHAAPTHDFCAACYADFQNARRSGQKLGTCLELSCCFSVLLLVPCHLYRNLRYHSCVAPL